MKSPCPWPQALGLPPHFHPALDPGHGPSWDGLGKKAAWARIRPGRAWAGTMGTAPTPRAWAQPSLGRAREGRRPGKESHLRTRTVWAQASHAALRWMELGIGSLGHAVELKLPGDAGLPSYKLVGEPPGRPFDSTNLQASVIICRNSGPVWKFAYPPHGSPPCRHDLQAEESST